MKKISLLILLVCIGFYSCNENKKEAEPEMQTVAVGSETEVYSAEAIGADFKEVNTSKMFAKYIDLKTALVNSDSEKAAAAANEFLMVIDSYPGAENGKTSVQTLLAATDIDAQRAAFAEVTKFVETQLKGALESGTIYKLYCPMAFNNAGAYWLSESKEIMNPYFGDKMLKCGRVDSEIN